MKVALCISGFFRGFPACLPTWHGRLFNSEHEFHAFICTGETRDWHLQESVDADIQRLNDFAKVIAISKEPNLCDPFPEIIVKRNFNARNISHVLSMFHKIKTSLNLKREYEVSNNFTYDVVVRLRPDTYLKSDILLDQNNDWNVPLYGDFGGLNDQMAWSNSSNMDYYGSIYDMIVPYLEKNQELILNPEYLVKLHWEKSGCGLRRPFMLYQLARDNVNFLPDNKTREEQFSQIIKTSSCLAPPPSPAVTLPTSTITNRRLDLVPRSAPVQTYYHSVHPPPPNAPARKYNRVVPSTSFPSPTYKKIK